MLDCLGLFELVKIFSWNFSSPNAFEEDLQLILSNVDFRNPNGGFWMPRLFPGKLARLSWKMKTGYWGDMISLFCRTDLKADVGIGGVCLVMLPS